jgi:hypothetical protein
VTNPPVEFRRGEFVLSTDRTLIDPDAVAVEAGSLIYMEQRP